MDKSTILKIENVDIKKIVYDNANLTDKGNFVVSNIWYNNKTLHSLNIQTPYLKVYRFLDGSVILLPDKITEDFLENLDKQTRIFIKNTGLFKKYSLQNFRYKALINEMDGVDKNVLRVRIRNETKPTIFFSSKTKIPMNYNDAKNIFFKVDNLKIILEIDKMIIDLKNSIVSTNIIARLVLLHEIVPKKIELTEYSFIESDNEDDNENRKKLDETDIILNTQTEYYDETVEDTRENNICEVENENKNKENKDKESECEESEGEESGKEDSEYNESKYNESKIGDTIHSDSSEEYDYEDLYNKENNNETNSENNNETISDSNNSR